MFHFHDRFKLEAFTASLYRACVRYTVVRRPRGWTVHVHSNQ